MRIWGFDLGTTSIGFAVVDHDPALLMGRIQRLGVRIFPEGTTEDKEPRNKTRRAKRLMRRGIRRRKLRRRLLNEALANAGLLPHYATATWDAVMAADPYALRRHGLTKRLEPYEVGRSLYHLAKRRGFAGRDFEDKQADPEDAAAKEDAKRLSDEIGTRTLGEFLAEQSKKRGRHHTRDMVAAEFDQLWAAQKSYHPILGDSTFESRVRDLVFFQRPTFWRLSTLARCQFCPNDELEPKGSWIGQEFLLLEQLTKIRIAGANARPLSNDERNILLGLAHRQKTITWDGARRALRKHWREREEPERPLFNMEIAKSEDGVKGNIVEVELRKIFGEKWDSHPKRDRIRREIYGLLWDADYVQIGKSRVEIRRAEKAAEARRKVRDKMQHEWQLTDFEAEAIAKLKLPGEWLSWSRTALAKMLPLRWCPGEWCNSGGPS
jgi:CRISPR-associated endonuclease Csn1